MSREVRRDRKRSSEESITQGAQCSNIENPEFSTGTPKQGDIEATANEYSEEHSQVSKTEKKSREDSHVCDIEGPKNEDLQTSNKEETKINDPQVSNTDILKDTEDFKMKKAKLESKQTSTIQLTTEDLDSSIEKPKHSRKRTSNMEEVETGNQQASNSKKSRNEQVADIKKPEEEDPSVVAINREKFQTLPLLVLKSEDSISPLPGRRDNRTIPSPVYLGEASPLPRHGRNDTRLPSPLFEIRETNPSEIRETNPSEIRETNPSEIRETNPSEIRETNPSEIRETNPSEIRETNPSEIQYEDDLFEGVSFGVFEIPSRVDPRETDELYLRSIKTPEILYRIPSPSFETGAMPSDTSSEEAFPSGESDSESQTATPPQSIHMKSYFRGRLGIFNMEPPRPDQISSSSPPGVSGNDPFPIPSGSKSRVDMSVFLNKLHDNVVPNTGRNNSTVLSDEFVNESIRQAMCRLHESLESARVISEMASTLRLCMQSDQSDKYRRISSIVRDLGDIGRRLPPHRRDVASSSVSTQTADIGQLNISFTPEETRTSNTSREGEQLLALATSDNIQPTDSAVQENLTETSLPNYDLVLRLNLSDNRPSEGENNCVLRPSSEVNVLCELPRNKSPILLNIALGGQSQTSGNISNLNTEECTEHQDIDSERHRSISTEASTSSPVNREILDHQSAIQALVRMLVPESPDHELSNYIRERFLRDAESSMVTEIEREFGENFDIDDLTRQMPVITRPHFMQVKSLLRDFVNLRTLINFRFPVCTTVDYKSIVPGFFESTETFRAHELHYINDIPQTFKDLFPIDSENVNDTLRSLSDRSLTAVNFIIKALTCLMKVCHYTKCFYSPIRLRNFLKVLSSCLHWYKLRECISIEDCINENDRNHLIFFLNVDSQIGALLNKLNIVIINFSARPY